MMEPHAEEEGQKNEEEGERSQIWMNLVSSRHSVSSKYW